MTLHDRFSLRGRTALVTGGSRGLGKAIASGLIDAGADVVVAARTAAAVNETAAELSCRGIALDVSDIDGVSKTVDAVEATLGAPVDVVVHAAGVQHRAPADTFPLDEWQRILQINLTAPFVLSQEIGRRQLAAERRGSHIFVGSLTSTLSIPEVAAYTASKSGVYGIIRGLSTEWSARGVRVNGVAPGYFRTQLTEAVFTDETRYQKMLDRIPMGRFGDPEELAGAAVFLASDAAAYVTGQLLTVDGGWTAA